MICQECNKEFKNLKALTTHIQFKHNNKQREYYDKWIKEKSEGFCKYCDKPTKFDSIQCGYQTYCSRKCFKIHYSKLKTKNNPMHSESAKLNQRNTNLKRYGVTQNTKRPEIKEQIKKTNKQKYGVENVSQNPIIKENSLKSRENTNLKIFGYKSSFSAESVKEKIKQSNLKKYGVEYATQAEITKNKIRQTTLDRYGVEYISQNFKFFEIMQKHGGWAKPYNENIYFRGSYEKDFLDKFYNKIEIKQGISFKYVFDNINKIYHSDFYIPSLNLIVEIKNSYLLKKDENIIKAKSKAVIKNGFDYITVVDKDYTEFSHKCLIIL